MGWEDEKFVVTERDLDSNVFVKFVAWRMRLTIYKMSILEKAIRFAFLRVLNLFKYTKDS